MKKKRERNIPWWQYKGRDLNLIDLLIEYIGFVYLIETHDGRRYIGLKFIYRGESWIVYTGSSDELDLYIKKYGYGRLKRTIIRFFYTATEMGDFEKKLIREHNAVRNPRYMNKRGGGNVTELNETSSITVEFFHHDENLISETPAKTAVDLKKIFGDDFDISGASITLWASGNGMGFQKYGIKDVYPTHANEYELLALAKKREEIGAETIRPITLIKTTDSGENEKAEYPSISEASRTLEKELNTKVSISTVHNWINGLTISFKNKKYRIKDIYYSDMTSEQAKELEAKRNNLQASIDSTSITVIPLDKNIEKFSGADSNKTAKSIKDKLGLDYNPVTIRTWANGDSVGYENAGIENIYFTAIEGNEAEFEKLEQRRIKSREIIQEGNKKRTEALEERWAQPGAREKQSQTLLDVFSNDPSIGIKLSEAGKRRYEDPEEVKKSSERQKKVLEENPHLREIWDKARETGIKNACETNRDEYEFLFESETSLIFKGRIAAGNHFGVSDMTISHWANGKISTYKQHGIVSIKKNGVECELKKDDKRTCDIEVWTETDSHIHFSSNMEFADHYGVSFSTSYSWCRNNSGTFRDYGIVRIKYNGEIIERIETDDLLFRFADGTEKSFKNVVQAAEHFKISTGTIYLWIQGKRTSFTKFGIVSFNFKGKTITKPGES